MPPKSVHDRQDTSQSWKDESEIDPLRENFNFTLWARAVREQMLLALRNGSLSR